MKLNFLLSITFLLNFNLIAKENNSKNNKDICGTSIRISLPSSKWIQTSNLENTKLIFNEILAKGFAIDGNSEYFLTFQHGSYIKIKNSSIGFDQKITYIMTRLSIKDLDGRILFLSDKESKYLQNEDMAIAKINQMAKQIKLLPHCSKL